MHFIMKEGTRMNGFLKAVLIIFLVVYIVSPIDLLPGPIDDIIIDLLSVAMTKKSSIEERE